MLQHTLNSQDKKKTSRLGLRSKEQGKLKVGLEVKEIAK
jgi:hypothetical protein